MPRRFARCQRGDLARGTSMANFEFDVVAIGEPLIEFNCREGGDSRTYLQGFGGDTSNMAIAAA